MEGFLRGKVLLPSVGLKTFFSYKSLSLPLQEYPQKYYPRYCYGWGVIMSPDVVFQIYEQSKNATFFWIDDVFVTGMLAEIIGINHVDLQPKLALDSDKVVEWISGDSISLPPLFGHPKFIRNSTTLYALWHKSQLYHRLMQH